MTTTTQSKTKVLGTPYAPFFKLKESVRDASEKQIIALIKTTWNLPETQRAREQDTHCSVLVRETIELACPFIETWDDAREIIEAGIATDPEAWDTVREYLAELLESNQPIGAYTRLLIARIMRSQRPKGKRSPAPATYHKDFQLMLCVFAVHDAGYTLAANDTVRGNAFAVVAEATEESFDSVKQAWQRNKIPRKKKGQT